MGTIVINLRGEFRAGQIGGVLLHYALTILCGLLLYVFVSKNRRRLPQFSYIFVILLGAFSLLIPFLPEALLLPFFNGQPPVTAISMAFLTPISLFLFGRAVPAGREGFAFALMLASSELIWALIFPLLGVITQGSGQALYLYSICSYMVGGAGLCIGATLKAKRTTTISLSHAAQELSGLDTRKKRQILGLIFLASIGMWGIMGLDMGVFIPKMTLQSETLGISHFIFLFLLPVFGYFWDSRPDKFILVCLPALACVIILNIVYSSGLIGHMPLYYMLNILQATLTVAVYATATKLFKTNAVMAIFVTLAHSLIVIQFAGVALQNLLSPYGIVLSFLIVFGIAFCLWRLRRIILGSQGQQAILLDLWTLQEPQMPIIQGDIELQKLSAFAIAYTLTARERDVLLCLSRGDSREKIGEKLGLTIRTVRHYLSNLQRKASVPNEKTLIDYYNSWNL
ncbi:MAG: helix-turn-helix transcriptional regulator [Deferribacteraceae bacterium]|nr:helix-turn-helix transcriptional regulator [Deferribacteraceae bacterium]